MPDVTDQTASPTLTAALAAVERGWAVIPGRPAEKRPYTAGDGWSASTDPDQVREWWRTWPDALVGINVGRSGMLVVDVDIHDVDENGFESIGRLCEGLGHPADWLDGVSLVSRSGSGGRHHLFRAPDGVEFSKRKIGWLPGVDVLSGDSFLVLPPSPHPSGGVYQWMRGPDTGTVEPLPPELLGHLLRAFSRDATVGLTGLELASVLDHGSKSGQRNQDLIRLIGWMRRTVGDGPEHRIEMRRRLEEWRDRCQPPYRGPDEDAEFERTWESGLSLDHVDRNPHWPVPEEMAQGGLRLLSPLGLAEWLEPRIGAFVRYRDETSDVLVWDGKRWAPNDRNDEPLWPALHRWGVVRQLEQVVRAQAADVRAQGDDRTARQLEKWLTLAMDRRYFSEAILTVACQAERVVHRGDLDAYPHLLHCLNGVVDLTTSQLRDHDPAYLNTALVPYPYDPHAASPALAHQLETMFPDDDEAQAFLRRAVGASIFGDNRTKALFVLRGRANTGKSTLLQALLPVLGSDTPHPYADMGDKKLFVEPRGDQHPAGLADALQHRLVLMSEEYGDRDRLNMPLLKAVTGGDRLKARFMRQDFWTGTARCTPWLATNHDLRLGEFDEAVRTRLRVIDVDREIPASERRLNVADELVAEAPGLLAWAVRGAREVHAGGLRPPARVLVAVDEMIADQDLVRVFMSDRTVPAAPGEEGTTSSDLYADYQAWCHWRGSPPLFLNEFAKRVGRALDVRGADLPRTRQGGQMVKIYPVRLETDGPNDGEWRPS